jgi:hypothetical protein
VTASTLTATARSSATAVAILAAVAAVVFGSLATGLLVTTTQGPRLVLAAAAALALFALGLLSPRTLVYVLFCWLAVLGLVRRLTTEVSPYGTADFLLLVGPVGLVALLMAAHDQGAFGRRSKLADAVLVLSILIALGSLNPLQGGPLVGFAGLLFMLVPVLWFWVGRSFLDDDTFAPLLKLIAGLGIAAALYGLAQLFLGFPHWDEAWIRDFGYTALNVEGHPRSFASFAAPSEYVLFLAMAMVVWVAFGLRPGWIGLTIAAVALLSISIFYVGSRGIVFVVAVALVVMAAAWRRLPTPFALVAGAMAIVLVPYLATRFAPASYGVGPQAGFVQRQVEGLSNPLGHESTFLDHVNLVEIGLRSAVHQPLGIGVGAVTLAGYRFGEVKGGTEADPSNIATALGLPGLLTYTVVFFIAMRRAYMLASRRRDALSFAVLGILVVTIFQWLNGSHYSVALLPWLALGWLDRTAHREPETKTSPRP